MSSSFMDINRMLTRVIDCNKHIDGVIEVELFKTDEIQPLAWIVNEESNQIMYCSTLMIAEYLQKFWMISLWLFFQEMIVCKIALCDIWSTWVFPGRGPGAGPNVCLCIGQFLTWVEPVYNSDSTETFDELLLASYWEWQMH